MPLCLRALAFVFRRRLQAIRFCGAALSSPGSECSRLSWWYKQCSTFCWVLGLVFWFV